MKVCSQFEKWGALFHYEELDTAESGAFEAHMKSCNYCQHELGAMQRTLNLMDQRSHDVPDEAFWQNFNENLQRRVQTETRIRRPKQSKFWIFQGLAAAALIALGVMLGTYWSASDSKPLTISPVPMTHAGAEAQFIKQANAYVSRSKTLLIGLVNMDIDPAEQQVVDFSLHRKASRELIHEAAYLREHYPEQAKTRLLELMDELEMIFLQISHLEKDASVDGLEVIQEGVSSGSLLLKINLEQLIPSLPQPAKDESRAL